VIGFTGDQLVDYGIRIGDYNNYAMIDGATVDTFSGSAAFIVYNENEAVGTQLRNLTGALESTTGLYRFGTKSNLAPFLDATYPTNRANIDFASMTVVGLGNPGTVGASYNHVITAETTLALFDADRVVRAGSGTFNVIVPLNATVPFTLNTEIVVENTGAGTVTITPVSGSVTINDALADLAIAQYERITLRKYGTDTWLAF
jgi:hypothetical protein